MGENASAGSIPWVQLKTDALCAFGDALRLSKSMHFRGHPFVRLLRAYTGVHKSRVPRQAGVPPGAVGACGHGFCEGLGFLTGILIEFFCLGDKQKKG